MSQGSVLRRGPASPVPGLRRRFERHYDAAKVLGHARLWRQRRHHPGPPVLVHQMGKVASQSVARSLEKASGRLVYQTHFVSEAGQDNAERVYRQGWDPTRGGPLHLWQGQWVRRQLSRHPGRHWQVVTVVRDPVARNVSSFFQVGTLQFDVEFDDFRLPDAASSVDLLRERFLQVYDEHEMPLRWCHDELLAPFGVDVFSRPFPHEKGYDVVRGARADVLVIRYEDLARVFGDAVQERLGLRAELLSTNVSSRKDYGDVYRTATTALTLPEEYLERMYGSRYARHFYTEQERLSMADRWRTSSA